MRKKQESIYTVYKCTKRPISVKLGKEITGFSKGHHSTLQVQLSRSLQIHFSLVRSTWIYGFGTYWEGVITPIRQETVCYNVLHKALEQQSYRTHIPYSRFFVDIYFREFHGVLSVKMFSRKSGCHAFFMFVPQTMIIWVWPRIQQWRK